MHYSLVMSISVFGRLLLIMSTAAAISCAANSRDDPRAAAPQGDASGLRGKVLRGPVLAGPLVGEEPQELPFRATFHVLDAGGDEVARFESNEEGEFEVLLPPGEYTIVPDETAPIMAPANQVQRVSVPAGQIIEVTLRFDTGMR